MNDTTIESKLEEVTRKLEDLEREEERGCGEPPRQMIKRDEIFERASVIEEEIESMMEPARRNKFRDYCEHCTKEECKKARGDSRECEKRHFKRVINEHTDINLGNCSYLDTCRQPEKCKYVHYEIDDGREQEEEIQQEQETKEESKEINGGQWIDCDIRKFDLRVLGKFGVVMADPPWDIRMTLPYGTLTDEEMRSLNVGNLVDNGFVFLWVTGRAMELGRECLDLWGFKLIEEIIWVKINQLQRVIRTGRTGHWLNHSKEHVLVGFKGTPEMKRMVDCDVIVSEVRETSRKPDEIYDIIERLVGKKARKLELFGRLHSTSTSTTSLENSSVRRGWIVLGNQLGSTRITDKCIIDASNSLHGSIEKVPGIISHK